MSHSSFGPASPVRELGHAIQGLSDGMQRDLERAKQLVASAGAELYQNLRALTAATDEHRLALARVEAVMYNPGAPDAGLGGAASSLLAKFVEIMVRVSHESMGTIEEILTLGEQMAALVKNAEGMDRIARETRLIALNARIETQRAGDKGRTFQVVADEVKRLATASLTASNRMADALTGCQTNLGRVQTTAERLASQDMSSAVQAHNALNEAVSSLEKVHGDLEQHFAVIEANVATTMRALQFEDMVTQILDATIARMHGAAAILNRFTDACADETGDALNAPAAEALRDLGEMGECSTVLQTTVDVGSVELF